MRRLLAAVLALLALPASAVAAVRVESVDSSAYPTIRATIVTPTAFHAPLLTENGRPVAGFEATNLGRAKSVVLLIDRSRSMRGAALAGASASARGFLAGKPEADRVAVVAFGSGAVALTDFSSSTTDADASLRTLGIDSSRGTALWDGVVLSARALEAEQLLGRVIVVLTDGRDTSSDRSFDEAVAAAREAGAAVYAVAIESAEFSGEPLRALARETGGSYYGTGSSTALASAYDRLAAELRRTWQVEYVTAARPGERVVLKASAKGESGSSTLVVPGTPAPDVGRPEPSGLLPTSLYGSVWGALLLALVVGALVLGAGAFALRPGRGSWLRGRLDPHLARQRRTALKPENRERLRTLATVFHATERLLGRGRVWLKLERVLAQAQVSLRTVEFAYLMAASGTGAAILGRVAGAPMLAVLLAFVVGGMVPYFVVVLKARKRSKAFENQLPDLLLTMAASLKVGHSFRQSMQSVVDEGSPPASKEFERVLHEARLGRPVDQALAAMTTRMDSKNLEFVVNAVMIQRQVGGSLAELFDIVAETIRFRQQFARKIKALTAMGRASAYVLVGLPFFMAALLTIMNPSYMDPLYHTSNGHKIIVIGLVMMCIGAFVLKRIVSFRS